MANVKIAQYYDYLTDRGVVVPDVSTVLTEIEQEMKALFGENLDTAPETAAGRLNEMLQRSRTFTIESMAAITNMFNLNTANGFFLDDLGALFLISRQAATKTTTGVVLGGVAGTIVPAGTRFQNNLGYIFRLQADYTIGTGSAGTAVADEYGPVPCPENSMSEILDFVDGLETVVNPSAPTLGRDLESDASFRERISASLNINSVSTLSAIKANLDNIPGVIGSYCWDNYTDTQETKDTVIIPPHSLLAVVDGGDAAAIARVLYNKKSAGCGYISGTTDGSKVVVEEETVVDEAYGTEYLVRFVRPDIVYVKVKIVVARKNYAGADLESAVKDALLAWARGDNPEVDGLHIGGVVSAFEASAAVSSTIPEILIRECYVGTGDATPAQTLITLDEIQKGAIQDASAITVEITEN